MSDVYTKIGLVLCKTEDNAFHELKMHHFTEILYVILYNTTAQMPLLGLNLAHIWWKASSDGIENN